MKNRIAIDTNRLHKSRNVQRRISNLFNRYSGIEHWMYMHGLSENPLSTERNLAAYLHNRELQRECEDD